MSLICHCRFSTKALSSFCRVLVSLMCWQWNCPFGSCHLCVSSTSQRATSNSCVCISACVSPLLPPGPVVLYYQGSLAVY